MKLIKLVASATLDGRRMCAREPGPLSRRWSHRHDHACPPWACVGIQPRVQSHSSHPSWLCIPGVTLHTGSYPQSMCVYAVSSVRLNLGASLLVSKQGLHETLKVHLLLDAFYDAPNFTRAELGSLSRGELCAVSSGSLFKRLGVDK